MTIVSVEPKEGKVGDDVVIKGVGLGAGGGPGYVTFNGVKAVPSSWTAEEVKVTVPAGAVTGPLTVAYLEMLYLFFIVPVLNYQHYAADTAIYYKLITHVLKVPKQTRLLFSCRPGVLLIRPAPSCGLDVLLLHPITSIPIK
jgi:hypothetical protein